MPNGNFDYNVFSQAYKQTQQAANARAVAKEELEQQYKKAEINLDYAKAREQDAKAKKEANAAAGNEYTPEGRALFNEIVSRDQSGLRGLTGKDRIMYFNDAARMGKTAQEILADRASTKGQSAEVIALDKRMAQIAPVEKSITQAGGFLDQAETAIKNVDLSALRRAGSFETWTKEQESDPKLSAYKARIGELRAEYSQVLAKGGATSVHSQEEAAKVVPDYITPAQFKEIRAAIRDGIETAKKGITDSRDEALHDDPASTVRKSDSTAAANDGDYSHLWDKKN